MKLHILWSVGEVVDGPHNQLLVHSGSLQLSAVRLDGVESTGGVKKDDPHNDPCLLQVREGSVQQIDDGILYYDIRPVGELQGLKCWVHQRAKVVQDDPELEVAKEDSCEGVSSRRAGEDVVGVLIWLKMCIQSLQSSSNWNRLVHARAQAEDSGVWEYARGWMSA